ncbi:MAG: hypothetical protein IH840_02310, partial [Candidatus Heimdallarchaeota archaeon]|nr:hypothetical protein [Candidatus Heimdallarchaeota archaeon]
KKMGKVLDENYSSLQELRNSNLKELVRIEGISDLTANYILEGINDHPIIDRLLENGVEIAFKKRRVKTPKKGNSSGLDAFFSNGTSETTFEDSEQAKQKVYVTGKIPGMTKKLVQQFIEDKGFDWSASISGKLSYLVIGEKAGGAKVDKAKKIGVEILTWDEFIQRVES